MITATFDLDAHRARSAAAWGLFRDRRPDLYEPLLTLDGGLEELSEASSPVAIC